MTATLTGTATNTTTVRHIAEYDRPLWQRLILTREAAIIGLFVLVVAVAAAVIPNFGSQITMTYLLLDMFPILIIALPMTAIIVTGEIDLSVASVVGFSSVLTGVLTQAGVPFGTTIIIAILAGLVCGLINGFLITQVGLPSLAVTIGTMALYRGLAVGLLGTTAVTDFPEWWTGLAKAKLGSTGIPVVMLLFVALALVFAVLLHFTKFGRGIFSIGLSSEAARFSGVNVARTKLVLFALSGAVAALAGIYYTLRYGSARGDNATGMEMQVIAAVLLGGVSIFGGRGALHGVIAGVLLIGVLASALRLANVTSDVINIITGVLLIAAVVSSSVFAAAKHRRRSGPKLTLAGTPTS
ncbi:ABC transporter permease [Leucobacter chromiireducens]|uniref:Autoinducer 2 import system permease protein LsrD n=1 Tax=Leucobacter chromiireducens subsp. solipictus TaxID=398235 RepID=A0ABS1SL52_9MICO|nr:ABC transporter permease [Leucobacter chromiireducens]MBL3680204.1 ABC transporter permease [Leucobacter chromiireducens subsp. solipictus]